jgi:polysaccharide pyruvyl transferase WcaK-like protein
MNLVQLKFSSFSRAKKIVAPISFGPFAYTWQEKLSGKFLKSMDLIMSREGISYDLLKKQGLNNAVLSSDVALLIPNLAVEKVPPLVLGFTLRNWLKSNQQKFLQRSVCMALLKFSRVTHAEILPIVQVDSPEFGDNDAQIAQEISDFLTSAGAQRILPTINITSINQGLNIYANLDLLLGMRMHSNILAATQSTPFISISYEHKTLGIAQQLKMQDYCLNCDEVNENNLLELLMKAYNKRQELAQVIQESLDDIKRREFSRWSDVLNSSHYKTNFSINNSSRP